MGKYLTEFSSNTAYNQALATLDYPNVSLVENELKYAESLPTMYRWVDDGNNTRCGGDGLDIEHDICTLYQQTKKQMSINGGQTWSDVVPAEYGYGDIIEEDSSECGCGEPEWEIVTGKPELGKSAIAVQSIDSPSILQQNTVFIWDTLEDEYIGQIVFDFIDLSINVYDSSDNELGNLPWEGDIEYTQWVSITDYFTADCYSVSSSGESSEGSQLDNFRFKVINC